MTRGGGDRRGLYECVCGKVKAEILIPPAGCDEPISCLCSCRDCVGFTNGVSISLLVLCYRSGPADLLMTRLRVYQQVIEASKKHFEGMVDAPDVKGSHLVSDGLGYVHFVILHDAEVTLTEGREYLRVVKLKEKSPVRRLYSACCGTPLGSALTMTGIHPQLIKPYPNKADDQTDFPDMRPTFCTFRESAPEGSAPLPEGCKAIKGISPGLFVKFVTKLSASLFKKKHPNTLRKEQAHIEPTIGIESIALES